MKFQDTFHCGSVMWTYCGRFILILKKGWKGALRCSFFFIICFLPFLASAVSSCNNPFLLPHLPLCMLHTHHSIPTPIMSIMVLPHLSFPSSSEVIIFLVFKICYGYKPMSQQQGPFLSPWCFPTFSANLTLCISARGSQEMKVDLTWLNST
jgi:hypothetical protein